MLLVFYDWSSGSLCLRQRECLDCCRLLSSLFGSMLVKVLILMQCLSSAIDLLAKVVCSGVECVFEGSQESAVVSQPYLGRWPWERNVC